MVGRAGTAREAGIQRGALDGRGWLAVDEEDDEGIFKVGGGVGKLRGRCRRGGAAKRAGADSVVLVGTVGQYPDAYGRHCVSTVQSTVTPAALHVQVQLPLPLRAHNHRVAAKGPLWLVGSGTTKSFRFQLCHRGRRRAREARGRVLNDSRREVGTLWYGDSA